MEDNGKSSGVAQLLATELANTQPDQHRDILGEALFPLIFQLEPELAPKVTGMILELDQSEVLHLIESPDDLKLKVAEAMDVLRSFDSKSLILGEALFPLVFQLEPELTPKVTGMILKLDPSEVLHLIESPDELKLKVAEAMDVLRSFDSQSLVTILAL